MNVLLLLVVIALAMVLAFVGYSLWSKFSKHQHQRRRGR